LFLFNLSAIPHKTLVFSCKSNGAKIAIDKTTGLIMQFFITIDSGRPKEIPVTAEFYVQNDFGSYDFYNIPQADFAKLSHKGLVPPPVFTIGNENVLCISQQPFSKENQVKVKRQPVANVVKLRAAK
jgi:hypothetical protein